MIVPCPWGSGVSFTSSGLIITTTSVLGGSTSCSCAKRPISVSISSPSTPTRYKAGVPHEGCDEGSGGMTEYILRGADLFQPALVHDGHPIGEGEGFLLVMGDKDGGCALPTKYRLHFPAHLAPHSRIQVAEGLIEEDDHGPGGQGATQRNPLLLSPRYLVRIPVSHTRHLNGLQDLLYPSLPVLGFHLPQPKADVLGHRKDEERGRSPGRPWLRPASRVGH